MSDIGWIADLAHLDDNCLQAVMGRLSKRYAKVTRLADTPTPKTRAIAAVVASVTAFAMTYFLLGIVWGAGAAVIWLCAIGAAVGAGYAAATSKWALGATYGVIAAIWVLFEAIAAFLAAVASAIG
ncbi:MAG: hypothetical protein ACM308_03990 [Qipengyuania vulgaris]